MSIAEPLPPPDQIRHPVGIVRIPAAAKWRVLLTSRNAVTCYTHFHDGRTVYCRRPEHDCSLCDVECARRWECYVSAEIESRRQCGILMLPSGAWAEVERVLGPDWRGNLRGVRLLLTRRGSSPRGPLECELLGREEDANIIPRGLDVPRLLERVWCLPPRFLDH